MGMGLTHQRTLPSAACDVPLSDPKVEGLWEGVCEQKMGCRGEGQAGSAMRGEGSG